MLTMTNDNDIASKFKVTIRISFVFRRIIVIIIRIRPNSKDPLFSTALHATQGHVNLLSDARARRYDSAICCSKMSKMDILLQQAA